MPVNTEISLLELIINNIVHYYLVGLHWRFQVVKNPPAVWETGGLILDWEDLLEKGIITHSSILASRTAWTEEPGWLQSMGVTKSPT